MGLLTLTFLLELFDNAPVPASDFARHGKDVFETSDNNAHRVASQRGHFLHTILGVNLLKEKLSGVNEFFLIGHEEH
jgi:hypothetical protein